jgi:hypothetical protein
MQLLAPGILHTKRTKTSSCSNEKPPSFELHAEVKDPLAFTPDMRRLGKKLFFRWSRRRDQETKIPVHEDNAAFNLHCERMKLEQARKKIKLDKQIMRADREYREYKNRKNLQRALDLFGYGEELTRWMKNPWVIKSSKQFKNDQRDRYHIPRTNCNSIPHSARADGGGNCNSIPEPVREDGGGNKTNRNRIKQTIKIIYRWLLLCYLFWLLPCYLCMPQPGAYQIPLHEEKSLFLLLQDSFALVMSQTRKCFYYLSLLFPIDMTRLLMYIQIVMYPIGLFLLFQIDMTWLLMYIQIVMYQIGKVFVNGQTDSVKKYSDACFQSISKLSFAWTVAESKHKNRDDIDRLQLVICVIRGSRYHSKVLLVDPWMTCLEIGLLFGIEFKVLEESGILCNGKFVSKTSLISELELSNGDGLTIICLERGGTKDNEFKKFDNSVIKFMKSVDEKLYESFHRFPKKNRVAVYQSFLSQPSSLDTTVFNRDTAQRFVTWLSDSIQTFQTIGSNVSIPAGQFPTLFIEWFSSQPHGLAAAMSKSVLWPLIEIEDIENDGLSNDTPSVRPSKREHVSSGLSPIQLVKQSKLEPRHEASSDITRSESESVKNVPQSHALDCCRNSKEEQGKRKFVSPGNSPAGPKRTVIARNSSNEFVSFVDQGIPREIEAAFRTSTSFNRFPMQNRDFRKRIYVLFASKNKLRDLLVSQIDHFRIWVSECFDHYVKSEKLEIDKRKIESETQDRFFEWLQRQDVSPEAPKIDTQKTKRSLSSEFDSHGTIPSAETVAEEVNCRAAQRVPGHEEGGNEELFDEKQKMASVNRNYELKGSLEAEEDASSKNPRAAGNDKGRAHEDFEGLGGGGDDDIGADGSCSKENDKDEDNGDHTKPHYEKPMAGNKGTGGTTEAVAAVSARNLGAAGDDVGGVQESSEPASGFCNKEICEEGNGSERTETDEEDHSMKSREECKAENGGGTMETGGSPEVEPFEDQHDGGGDQGSADGVGDEDTGGEEGRKERGGNTEKFKGDGNVVSFSRAYASEEDAKEETGGGAESSDQESEEESFGGGGSSEGGGDSGQFGGDGRQELNQMDVEEEGDKGTEGGAGSSVQERDEDIDGAYCSSEGGGEGDGRQESSKVDADEEGDAREGTGGGMDVEEEGDPRKGTEGGAGSSVQESDEEIGGVNRSREGGGEGDRRQESSKVDADEEGDAREGTEAGKKSDQGKDLHQEMQAKDGNMANLTITNTPAEPKRRSAFVSTRRSTVFFMNT